MEEKYSPHIDGEKAIVCSEVSTQKLAKGMPVMQQQFDEEEDGASPSEDNEAEKQDIEVIRQMVQSLLQYHPVRVFLLIFGCILLAAIIQGGLLGPLIIIIVIGAVVFLARGQATIDMIERWMNAPINLLLRKLLIENPSGLQMDDFMQEQTKVQPFADIRILDDLQLLPPPAFEQLVGDVMQRMDYAQVRVDRKES
jgi:hypothetical protein